MAENLKQVIDRKKLEQTNAGKLVQSLLARGKLNPEDLENPDIIELINNTKEVNINVLQVGDRIYVVEDFNTPDDDPKHSIIKANVADVGIYSTLGYDDSTRVLHDGVTVSGIHVFPKSSVEKYTQMLLPLTFPLVILSQGQRLFRVNFDVEATNKSPLEWYLGKLAVES